MADEVTDLESFKQFIRKRTLETWDERRTPYYLSFVATDLKRLGVDYRELVSPLRLSQWASANDVADVALIAHPTQRARIGFVPKQSGFKFDTDESVLEQKPPTEPHVRHGRSLVQFVQSLSNLPDSAISDFSVPAKTLIALLKS
jgi:hypothetical protein